MGAGRAVHDWSNNGTHKAYAAAVRAFRDSGYLNGMFWDGVQHRFQSFNRVVDASPDYPTGDGRTSARCSSDDILHFHAGELSSFAAYRCQIAISDYYPIFPCIGTLGVQ